MSVFVGIDGGGSTCRVLAVDSEGKSLYQGQSGAANLVTTPESRLRRNLSVAAQGCPRPTAVCGCFAGLVSEPLRRRAEAMLRDLFPGAAVRAEPDYAAALYASEPGTDMCVIAGTGSLVCSRGGDGIVKSGGRGFILGDFGSGYHFGRDALIHFLDHPASASPHLRKAIREVFGSEEEAEIIPSLYTSATPAGILARLAQSLGRDAQAGEAYAADSLTRNFALLTSVVEEHVANHLADSASLSISLSGGVWKAASVFKSSFEASLRTAFPTRQIRVERLHRPPIHGAVALAQEVAAAGS